MLVLLTISLFADALAALTQPAETSSRDLEKENKLHTRLLLKASQNRTSPLSYVMTAWEGVVRFFILSNIKTINFVELRNYFYLLWRSNIRDQHYYHQCHHHKQSPNSHSTEHVC